MKMMNRRDTLKALACGASSVVLGSLPVLGKLSLSKSKMGMVVYSLNVCRRNNWEGRHAGLSPALAVLEECKLIGAGGMQLDLKKEDLPHVKALRERVEGYGMYYEGIVKPPKNKADVARFENDIRNAKEAGAKLARTVIIPGRRYERFHSWDEFREYEKLGEQSLQLAEPVLRKHQFKLAVENHKDHRTWERLALLERISSEWIGVTMDVGNNLALMEDPLEVAKAFAPWSITVHIKDQAMRDDPEGFWLYDIPLGEGVLKLPEIVKVLQRANPDIKFNYECITRDPIKVPVLTHGYWSTLDDTPPKELARTMRTLKNQEYAKPFPLVTQLSVKDQLILERSDVLRSLSYANKTLALV